MQTTVACFSEEFQEETLEMGNERRSWRPKGHRRALDFVLCRIKKKYQEPKRRNKRRVPTKIPKGVRNYCLASTAASRGCCYGFLVGSLYIKSPFTLWLKYGFARYATQLFRPFSGLPDDPIPSILDLFFKKREALIFPLNLAFFLSESEEQSQQARNSSRVGNFNERFLLLLYRPPFSSCLARTNNMESSLHNQCILQFTTTLWFVFKL